MNREKTNKHKVTNFSRWDQKLGNTNPEIKFNYKTKLENNTATC